jgi:tetratricopeptide (TPR) repeat protein
MAYLNTYKLIEAITLGKELDAKALIAEVDKQKVLSALKRSKQGIPKPVPYTDEPIEEKNLSLMPQKEKETLWDIYGRLSAMGKNYERDLAVLFALREKYPKVPCIYNYISVLYQNTGQMENLVKSLRETTRIFPDYLFGKTALAEYYLQNSYISGIPPILEHKFELYLLCPEKELFHISEVRAFYALTGMYHAEKNHLARAFHCYYLLEEIDPDHALTIRLARAIVLKEWDDLRQKMNKTRTQGSGHRR